MALIIPKRENVKTKSKLVIPEKNKTTTPTKVREVGLPEHLGGGRYLVSDKPGELIKSPRSQDALPAVGTAERDHIISVALGGTSNKDNLQYLATTKEGRQSGKVSVEQQAINDYVSGKISLGEARLKVATKQQQIKGLTPTEKEQTTAGQLGNVIKDAIKGIFKPFSKESREEAQKYGAYGKELLTRQAKNASEITGREIKPENFTKEVKKLKPEELQLLQAKSQEKSVENLAKTLTAPVRFTAGSLATAVTSYALERGNSDAKYTPKTEAEKLIIGEGDVKRLLKQEDLYGTIARGAGVPVALLSIAILESPFIQGTGASKLVKEALEKEIKKLSVEQLSKLGAKEIIRVADSVIKTEQKAGKLTSQEAEQAVKELSNIKVVEQPKANIVIPEKTAKKLDSLNPTGGVFSEYTPQQRVEAELADNITTLDKTMGKSADETITIYRGSSNGGDIIPGDFITTNKQLAKDYAGTGVVSKKKVKLSDILDDVNEPLGEEYIYKPVKDNKAPELKYEPTIAQPSIPNRIKNESIEKGIKADFQGIEEYDKVSFKDQAEKVGQIIDENPEKAINIALGKELPTNGALPESVFIAVKNQAIKKGDTELLIRLATEEGGVAKESTILGQRIKMLDEQLEDDAFRNINNVVKARRANFEKGGVSFPKAKSLEINKIKSEVAKVKPVKDEWLAFVDEIVC